MHRDTGRWTKLERRRRRRRRKKKKQNTTTVSRREKEKALWMDSEDESAPGAHIGAAREFSRSVFFWGGEGALVKGDRRGDRSGK